MRSHRLLHMLFLSSTLSGLLYGCVVQPLPPSSGGRYYSDDIGADMAPPPPREEYIGVAPQPGYLWIGGYWNWAGNRHSWVNGHWEAPRRGEHWVPHRWVRQGERWHLNRGRWEGERRGGEHERGWHDRRD